MAQKCAIQLRLPGHGAIFLPHYARQYPRALYDLAGMWLYTNRGIGCSPCSYRINCPPEITEITLIGV